MTKRMIVSFTGGLNRLRISQPGINVDTATPQQLLLDERVLYDQIHTQGYYNRSGKSTETVTVTIPNLGFIPLVRYWMVDDGSGNIYWPYNHFEWGSGDNLSTYLLQPSNTSVQFYWQSDWDVAGVYYQIFRIPRDG